MTKVSGGMAYILGREISFCHSPVDIRSSALAGVSGSERSLPLMKIVLCYSDSSYLALSIKFFNHISFDPSKAPCEQFLCR